MKVEYIDTDKLREFERNPKIHPESQLKKLKKSISEFGWTNPILATKDGMVVAGHARLEAAKRLNIGNVPVIYLDMPYEKAIAYVIADNRLAELAETDTAQLSELLGELSAIPDFDIELTGFDIDEVASLNPAEVVEDNFDVGGVLDDIDEPVTKLGDIILLGRHRLMCGDSTEMMDVEALMDGEKTSIVITDPPYGIDVVQNDTIGGSKELGFVGNGGGSTKAGKNKIVDANKYHQIIGDNTTDTAQKSYELCVSMNIKNMVILGGNYFTDFLPSSPCWIIWDKENTGNFADVEMAWTSFETGAKLYKWLWNGLSRKGDRKSELKSRVHPTQKPVGLHGDILNDFTKKDDIVLDMFLGSGTTLIAAEQTNRICYGMELDPKYCDVIVRRFEDYTRLKAIRPKQ